MKFTTTTVFVSLLAGVLAAPLTDAVGADKRDIAATHGTAQVPDVSTLDAQEAEGGNLSDITLSEGETDGEGRPGDQDAPLAPDVVPQPMASNGTATAPGTMKKGYYQGNHHGKDKGKDKGKGKYNDCTEEGREGRGKKKSENEKSENEKGDRKKCDKKNGGNGSTSATAAMSKTTVASNPGSTGTSTNGGNNSTSGYVPPAFPPAPIAS